jgi:hypothetical protein
MSKQKVAYLKIGNEKAHSFYDQKTKVSIANHQVVEVPFSILKEAGIKRGLSTLHITQATEAEYNAYVSEQANHGEKVEMQALVKEERKKLKQKRALKIAKETISAESDSVGDEDDEEEDTIDEDFDDEDELTKSEMIDAIKDSDNITADEKKGLAKKSLEDLKALYEKTK